MSLLTAPALAWEYGETDLVYYAFEMDSTGRFGLAIDCDADFGEYTLAIESREPWDETTSYAPKVPTTFVIDGTEITDDSFRFVRRGELLTVELYEYDDVEGFGRLYEALYAATGPIEVRYFDKVMRFASDGLADTFDEVEANCWF